MDDIRWFAPNRYCALPVPALRQAGLTIATSGDAGAGAAVAADGQCAVEAYEYSRRHRCPLLFYAWDLPPWRLGRGKPDLVVELAGKVVRVPRPFRRYSERAGYYSRLRFVARKATRVWCPSTNTQTDLRIRFGILAERMPFCFDSDRFRLDQAGSNTPPAGAPVVLSVSRLVPHKNHAAIVRAVARLDRGFAVRIIGQGPEAPALRELARSLGVSLVLTDTWASDEDVLEAYRTARVVVSASRFEGFGLTPIEGLAMGAPVVASDIPPHREFLRDAVRYVSPDDEAALAREIASAADGGNQQPVPPALLDDLTIESCARRFLPGLGRLIGGSR